MLKKFSVILFLLLVIIPLKVSALTVTTSQIGATTHYNFSDGISGTSFQVGGTTHYSFSNGISGTSFQIGGTTHYNFSDPVSEKSYDLGSGNQAPVHVYTPGEYYSSNGLTLINNTCKGLSSTVYPDWTKRGIELTTKCLGDERVASSDSDWSSFGYQNAISKCTHESPEKALKEILDICTKEQAKLYINRVNLALSNLQKKEEPCPQFSVLWTDTPTCANTEQHFPVNKKDCCICYLDYRNYNRSCIPEAEYNKKIKESAKDKKVVVIATTSPKQELAQSNNTEEIIKEIPTLDNSVQITQEKTNQINKQQITNTNLEKPSNPVKLSWFRRFINFIFGKK